MKPINAEIVKVKDEARNIKTFYFNIDFTNSIPGQFLMIWIRGVDEIPMSLSYSNAITVQKVGEATTALFKLKKGDSIGIRGPYGNGFKIIGNKNLIIAGGVGAAALALLAEKMAEKNIEVTTLLGAKTKSELLFIERFEKAGKLFIATDDGTLGYKGYVTELIRETGLDFDQIYICGPELMMAKLLRELEKNSKASIAQFSLSRYIKCGIGLCGSCCIDPSGLRVCREGPVFKGDSLINSELGKYMRNSSGKKVRVR
ncbi:MAG: dihydroorotate dehydrogenase electron transfer subunit [Methanocellales archaeon]